MELLKRLQLFESERSAKKEIEYAISTVNQLYNDWKAVKRRMNASNLISKTANKLSSISPSLMDRVHEVTKVKAAILIMRCLDIPYFSPLSERALVYKKLRPLFEILQNVDVQTGNGSTLKETVFTRLSAAYCFQNRLSDGTIVFVAYEGKITPSYLRYLFGNEDVNVKKVYKMKIIGTPGDFASLVDLIKINHEKALDKYHKELSKIK